MAKENQASHAKIGFTVLVGIAAIVATLIYLGGMRGKGEESLVETYYDKGVSGLSVGSPVNLRGVKVGEVREISFVGTRYDGVNEIDGSRVYIKMAIYHRAMGIDESVDEARRQQILRAMRKFVERGLRSTITSSAITGLSRIELGFFPGDPVLPADKLTWTPRHLYIPSTVSLLDNFSDSATKVMNQINKMDLGAAWSNIAATVSALARTAESAQLTVESRQADLERMMEDLSDTTRQARELVYELRQNPSLLIRERKLPPLAETQR